MRSMHPAIRMANLLLLIAVVAHAPAPVLVVIALSAVVMSGKELGQCVIVAARFGWRLRWLLLSLLVLYLAFIPGTPLFPHFSSWLPSQEGLWAGAERLWAWSVMLFLFALFHLQTRPAEWQAGIYWLVKPFARLGWSAERLTLRMMLTFNAVAAIQRNYQSVEHTPAKTPWHNFPARLALVLRYAHEQAEHAELNPIQVETTCPPTSTQWLSFIVLFGMLMGLVWLDYFLFGK